MFPGVDGFHWTFGHIVFLALFFAVVLTIVTTVARAVLRSVRDFRTHRVAGICWQVEFAELPDAERRCRHEIARRIEQRTCPNGFDCRGCTEYERYAALPGHAASSTFGLNYPADRLYHRGHTWVHAEADGVYTVGLDDFAEHLIGEPGAVQLPEVGSWVEVNGAAWRVRKGRTEVRVRAPMEGEVVATGGPEQGWYLKVRPQQTPNLRHLLRGEEVSAWISKELERLQIQLGPAESAPSLADGGILMNGLVDSMPQADWDTVLAGTFLEA